MEPSSNGSDQLGPIEVVWLKKSTILLKAGMAIGKIKVSWPHGLENHVMWNGYALIQKSHMMTNLTSLLGLTSSQSFSGHFTLHVMKIE